MFGSVMLSSALILTARGGVLFRYGTMSIAFYLASLAALAIFLALALVLCRWQAVKPLIDLGSLSGVRSLAVVPLHYLYVNGVEAVHGPVVSFQDYLALGLLGVLICFVSSAAIPWLVSSLIALGWSQSVKLVTWVAVAVALWTLGNDVSTVLPESLLRFGGQLALCLLLALSPSRRTEKRPA
jgi:hypothetical protein